MGRSRAMTTPDRAGLQRLAAECVDLVARQFGRHLDGSLASLEELDTVCADLLANGPLNTERLDLWWKLIGAYTGQALVSAYGGEWIVHEKAPGAFAVSVRGMTAFPFAATDRVLRGEPYKSLASFARALPAIEAHAQADPPSKRPAPGGAT
jgi:hypothetical protein